MAQNMFILTCLSFSLLLIFITQEIHPIDGRPLKGGKKNELQTRSKIYENESTNNPVRHEGHSSSEASLIANNNAPATATPSSVVVGSSQAPPPPARDASDFRPTAPGHSPGVGHSIQN